jgi:hypothetical protein
MTTIINDGLPEPLFLAIRNDPYSPGDADYTPSSLNSPARMRELVRQHGHEMTQAASGRFWSFMGSAIHAMLERVDLPGALKEERLYGLLAGKKISGALDLFWEGVLYDYKVTSVWALIHEAGKAKPEWVQQSNVNAWLLRRNGHEVKRAANILILRDWNDREVGKSSDYPKLPAVEVPIPLWSDEEVEDWMKRRIMSHEVVRGVEESALPECSPAERWEKAASFAVMKAGNKRAVRVLPTLADAQAHMAEKGLTKYHSIEDRKGESIRCGRYCSALAWCSQGRRLTAQEIQE